MQLNVTPIGTAEIAGVISDKSPVTFEKCGNGMKFIKFTVKSEERLAVRVA